MNFDLDSLIVLLPFIVGSTFIAWAIVTLSKVIIVGMYRRFISPLTEDNDYDYHKSYLDIARMVDKWIYLKKQPAFNSFLDHPPPEEAAEFFAVCVEAAKYLEYSLITYATVADEANLPSVLMRWRKARVIDGCDMCRAHKPQHTECIDRMDAYFGVQEDLENWAANYLEMYE